MKTSAGVMHTEIVHVVWRILGCAAIKPSLSLQALPITIFESDGDRLLDTSGLIDSGTLKTVVSAEQHNVDSPEDLPYQ